jgi:hypothetical protein
MRLLLYRRDGQNTKPPQAIPITTMRQRRRRHTQDQLPQQRPHSQLLPPIHHKVFYNTKLLKMPYQVLGWLSTTSLLHSNKAAAEVDFKVTKEAEEETTDRGIHDHNLQTSRSPDILYPTASPGCWYTRSMADGLCTIRRGTRVSGGYQIN